jgi:hypothetical protein
MFNDDVNEDLINLHHHQTPFEIIPELMKNYRIDVWEEDSWTTLHRETDNRMRTKRHSFQRAVTTNRLRLVVESTNGSDFAEVIEIRAYDSKGLVH